MRERWEEVESLFGQALAVPASERPTFLASRAGGDADLRVEVESLLAADAASGSFLGEADAGVLPSLAAGARVGAYELLRELGRGGSGIVYLGRRSGLPPGPEVAIKLLRPGLADRGLARRFQTERAILARLEHPNVARLLDAGSFEDGPPFYVMEQVEGSPIDRYCDERRLSVEGRLRLFATVCDTVEFAHRHGVVHRDIKPANILVTADGIPKLLDFGIAKLLSREVLPSAETTGPWMRVLTPQYASPEQVLGGPIGPASDVYSLGVLLYLLLTGRLPYRLPPAGLEEVGRMLRDSKPPRPSAVVLGEEAGRQGEADTGGESAERRAAARGLAPRPLARRLSGDLDAIVARALAKRPEHRHGAAGELAADVRDHLSGKPVRARAARSLAAAWRASRPGRGAATALVLAGLALGATVAGARRWVQPAPAEAPGMHDPPPAARICIPDGAADDTLRGTDCCSGVAVSGSTVCEVATDFGTTWSSCRHLCGSRPRTCIPAGGVDDTLRLTDCCSGTAVPGSTRCLDPADFGTSWQSCIQTCA